MVLQFLEKEKLRFEDLKDRYDSFQHLFQKKLWHQLTLELREFILDHSNWRNKESNLIALYDHFISHVKPHLNEVAVVQFQTVIAQQVLATSSASEAIQFLEKEGQTTAPSAKLKSSPSGCCSFLANRTVVSGIYTRRIGLLK